MSDTTIEHLPECIIVHILSLLPTIDAIKATITHRSLRNLWFQLPSLSFDIVPIHSPSNSYRRTRELFSEIVNQAISARPFLPMKRFHLRFDCGITSDFDSVDNWILYAINSNVSELDLDFDVDGLSSEVTEEIYEGKVYQFRELIDFFDYTVDFSYLINSTVEDLKLRRCKIEIPSSVGTNELASIRSLLLDDLLVEDEVAQLIQNCMNLENLTVQYTSFPTGFKILSSTLRKCELLSVSQSQNVVSLEIYAPNLNSIIFEDVSFAGYHFEDVPNLVEVQVSFSGRQDSYGYWCELMSSLNNIEYLSVQNMYLSPQEMFESHYIELTLGSAYTKRFDAVWDASQSYKFDKLSRLDLLSGYTEADIIGICSFLQHCDTLESLTIDHCYYCYDEKNNTEAFVSLPTSIHIPRLRQVKMKNHRGCIGEIYILELIKFHQVVLEEVVAFPAPTGEIESMPFSLWTAPNREDWSNEQSQGTQESPNLIRSGVRILAMN